VHEHEYGVTFAAGLPVRVEYEYEAAFAARQRFRVEHEHEYEYGASLGRCGLCPG